MATVDTPLGAVTTNPINEPIPEGWRILSLQEGKQIKEHLLELVGEWGIVGFDTGKLDGSGYGNNISDTRAEECGEIFIIQGV